MTTLTVNISNDNDLPVLKEILTRFGLPYVVQTEEMIVNENDRFYSKLKQSFKEVKDWEERKVSLQDAKAAIAEIENELKNDI